MLVGESTDITSLSVLLAFVRHIYSILIKVKNKCLCANLCLFLLQEKTF